MGTRVAFSDGPALAPLFFGGRGHVYSNRQTYLISILNYSIFDVFVERVEMFGGRDSTF
jgi:hypothetical protein